MNLATQLAQSIPATRSDAIIAADRDGIIGFWNPGAERLFGYPADEAIGRSLDLIIPARFRQRHWDGYRRVIATGESRYGADDVLSVPARRKDGVAISVEFTIVPLVAGGCTIGLAAILRDVTERFQELRALRQKLAKAERQAD